MSSVAQRLAKVVKHRHFVLICVLCGVILRILWIALINPQQVSDYKWYYDRAVSIASDGGYSVDGVPTAYWPVGFPGFLGLLFTVFGTSAFVGKIVNIILYTAMILLVYRISKDMFHSEMAARITVLILCFYPNHIAYTALLSAEIWFSFLLVLGAWLLLVARGRIGYLALTGLLWGLAVLTKPQFIFLPLIFMLVFLVNWKLLLRSAVIVYVMIFACLAPWMRRNDRLLGKPLLSTNGGIVLMQSNNPYATGKHMWDERLEAMLGDLGHEGWGRYEVAREERARHLGIWYIRNHPGHTLALWPRKIFYLYHSDIEGFFYTVGMIDSSSRALKLFYVGSRILGEFYYIVILAMAILASKVLLRAKATGYKMGVYLALYFTAICLVFHGNPRYHFPIMPWMAMDAGVGGALLLGVWRGDEGEDSELGLEH